MPHTRSPRYRRRMRLHWPCLLTLTTLLTVSWLPFTDAQKQSAADFYVHSLPGAPDPLLKMYAGHIEVTPEHHGNLFFWLFQNRHIAHKQRTVIWFNGGPGCSSMDGALMEIGPYRVNKDGTLRVQEGGWDEFANVLFVDNPVGTGFSYVDGDALIHDLDEMAEQMVSFLEQWFDIFPEYSHHDIYIAGESYAGQHIPYIASAILSRNNKKPPKQHWHLNGLLIGNGWISSADQYISYIPFAYETGIMTSGSDADDNARRQEAVCLKALSEGGDKRVDVAQCEQIMMAMNKDLSENGECFNIYDVRLKDSYPSCGMNWPPDLAQVTPYLRREDVTQALNINKDKMTGWRECNDQVNRAFNAAHSKPSRTLLPDLLKHMPILLFSGDKDLICNHVGTENLIANLEWNGAVGMEAADVREWTFDDEPAGQWQEARNLTYLRFYNSSHMVPFDYPKRARDMLDRFIGGDVQSIDGKPKYSIIEGEDEKGVQPEPGKEQPPPPNQTNGAVDNSKPTETEAEKIQAAKWEAYRRSGEAALVVVLIAATGWGIFVWRDRRRRRRQGYKHVSGADPGDRDRNASRLGLSGAEERFRRRERDVEEAREFNEEELDDLSPDGVSKERYALTDEDDDADDGRGGRSHPGR